MKRRNFLSGLLASSALAKTLFAETKKKKPPFPGKANQDAAKVVIKVLGTAQDGGYPQVGCYCPNCLRARRESGYARLISSLAIFDLEENKFFMVDATPDIRVQLEAAHQRLHLKKTDSKNPPHGILLSHAHIGHYTGLVFFGYEAMSTDRLPVFCSQRMRRFLSDNGPWGQLVSLKNISIQPIEADKKFYLTKRIAVTPFLVPHRHEYSDTLGFLICGPRKKLLYISDIQSWDAWQRSIEEEADKVDIALLDGTFYSDQELPGRSLSQIGHPFIKTTIKILKNVIKKGRTKIYFIHLNHSNLALDPRGEARKKVEEEGFFLAHDGMEFYL